MPAKIVYEDDKIIGFDDINPKAPVHVLLIPKKHNAKVFFGDAARAVAKAKNVSETGYRLIINRGSHAGQEVDHLHMHLLGGRPLGPMISK